MKRLALAIAILVGAGCATRPGPIGYLPKPNAQADKVMVEDAVTELSPHCTTVDYGTIQFDSRLSGEFFEGLKAAMVQRGCNVLSVAPPVPAGTTRLSFCVDSVNDALERRLTLIARGSEMSRLYVQTEGHWLAVGAWSVGASPIKR